MSITRKIFASTAALVAGITGTLVLTMGSATTVADTDWNRVAEFECDTDWNTPCPSPVR